MRKILLLLMLTSMIYSQQQVDIPWPTLANSPWPMVAHDPQLTGRSPYIGPKTPTIKWTLDLPYGVLSGPIIGEDGTLYIGTRAYLGFTGDTTNYFYAINPDGTIKWTFLTGDPHSNESGYLINNEGTIFFGSQSGWLYAIDSDGNLKWKYNTGSNISQRIMNTDHQGNIYITNASDSLYSFSKEGQLNWKVNYGGRIFPRSVAIAPDGNTIYVSAADSNIYALNLDGSIKWSTGCIGTDRQPLLVDNSGNIYFGSGCSIPRSIISLASLGQLRWEYLVNKNGGNTWIDESSLAMDYDGNIYFFYGTQIESTIYGRIESIDYYGNYNWTYQFEEPYEWILMPLVVDKVGTVYCGSTYGYYYYAISNQGELLWKLPLNGYYVDNSTAIDSDGTLYIGTHKGSLWTNGEKTLIAIRDTGTVSVNEEPVLIKDYELLQNYPNPFNPNTIIKYQLPVTSFVSLKVYDILGRELKTLVNEEKPAGKYDIIFDGSDLLSGVYFYELVTDKTRITKKMILLR